MLLPFRWILPISIAIVLAVPCRVAAISPLARSPLLQTGGGRLIARARRQLGAGKFLELVGDMRCDHKQPDPACASLCLGTPDCVGACLEVRTMLCVAPALDVSSISAAATAAATNAVHDALQTEIAHAISDAATATQQGREEIVREMGEARRVAKKLAKDAGKEADVKARKATEDDSAANAYSAATTAAATADVAVRAAQASK